MKKFKVIEERGCGIEYTVFSGTKKECAAIVKDMASFIKEDAGYPPHEQELHNGNGEPFSYKVVEE